MGFGPVDKSGLEDAIDEAGDLDPTDYSEASWSALASALSAAEVVAGDPAAVQSAIDAAEQSLRDALGALTVDKSGLEDASDEDGDRDQTDYSKASCSALASALSAAEVVAGDPAAVQAAIDAAEQ